MTNPKNGEAIKNDLIRRGDALRAVNELPIFSERMSDGENARAVSMICKANNAINAIPAAPDTPDVAVLVEALTVIDALDPDGLIDGCSQNALRGLVLRMGQIARAAIAAWEARK